MPNARPRREDIPEDVKPADILHELRLFRYEFERYREEINGDHAWLTGFRAWVTGITRLVMVVIPVLLAAALALHLGGALA
jgi:hypothetical protein